MRINQEIYFYYLNKKSNKKSIFQKFIFRKHVINIHQVINYNTYFEYYHFNQSDCDVLLLQVNKHKIYKYLFDYINKIELENLQKNRRYYTYKKYFKKLQDKYLNSLK